MNENRLSFQVLEIAIARDRHRALTTQELYELLQVSERTVQQKRQDGLSWKQADRYAVQAGLHPADVWGVEWWRDD